MVSQETIKPSSPTPIHLRNYKLSLLDHYVPSMSISFVLLYQKCNTSSVVAAAADEVRILRLLQQLKKSLSETLTHYYPFAGRLSDDKASVDCNDSGVEFVTARIKCHLSEILKRPDPEAFRRLFFHSTIINKNNNDSNKDKVLLSIQASFLNCGGMGIGVSVSHKVADISSIIHFLRHWSSLTASSSRSRQEIDPPLMNACSIFPANDIGNVVLDKGHDVVTKRFVFSSSTLAALKKEKTNTIVADHHRGVGDVDDHYQQRCINPTRVQLVLALILKSATAAASRAAGGHLLNPKACLMQVVNLRERMKPLLPVSTFGNIIWPHPIAITKPDDLGAILSDLREGIIEFNAMELLKHRGQVCASMFDHAANELKELLSTSNQTTNLQVYINSSWCRFPIYQVDFGWGSPVWVGLNMDVTKNTIYLVDTPKAKGEDDGIEAWISLEPQEMELFQVEEDILAYASLNPSVLQEQKDSSSS